MARKGDAALALSLVTEIRERYNLSCPVDLEDLAEKLGVDVYFRPFSEEIDGFYAGGENFRRSPNRVRHTKRQRHGGGTNLRPLRLRAAYAGG